MSHPAHRARLLKETALLETAPPPGVTAWRVDGDSMTHWQALLRGPADTPYVGGSFKLDVRVPGRYPFEPPSLQFLTPIHHPNIDSAGRICLDTLHMPPKGSWSPASNLSTVLSSVLQLVTYPNPRDGLLADVTQQFNEQHDAFVEQAKQMTRRHAMGNAARTEQHETSNAQEDAAAQSAVTAEAAAPAAAAAAASSSAADSSTAAAASATSSAPAAASDSSALLQAPTASPPASTKPSGDAPAVTAATPSLAGSKRPAELTTDSEPAAQPAAAASGDSSSAVDDTTAHADKKQKTQHEEDDGKQDAESAQQLPAEQPQEQQQQQ